MNGERLEGVRVLQLGDILRLGTTELAVTDADGHIPEPTQIGSPAVTHVPIPEELVVVEGLAKGKRLTLDEEMVIGRAESGEGRLGDDPELSRKHARVFREAGRVVVEDLGSANGTYVNAVRLSEPRILEPGDLVRMGRTTLELTGGERSVEPATPPPAPPPRPRRRSPYLRRDRPRRRRRRPPTRSRSGRSSPAAASRRSSASATWASCTARTSSRSSETSRSR